MTDPPRLRQVHHRDQLAPPTLTTHHAELHSWGMHPRYVAAPHFADHHHEENPVHDTPALARRPRGKGPRSRAAKLLKREKSTRWLDRNSYRTARNAGRL